MPIKAALELVTSQQYNLASKVLALSGESLLAVLVCITQPEETDKLGYYGCAEVLYSN